MFDSFDGIPDRRSVPSELRCTCCQGTLDNGEEYHDKADCPFHGGEDEDDYRGKPGANTKR